MKTLTTLGILAIYLFGCKHGQKSDPESGLATTDLTTNNIQCQGSSGELFLQTLNGAQGPAGIELFSDFEGVYAFEGTRGSRGSMVAVEKILEETADSQPVLVSAKNGNWKVTLQYFSPAFETTFYDLKKNKEQPLDCQVAGAFGDDTFEDEDAAIERQKQMVDAVFRGDYSVAKRLLEAGADPNEASGLNTFLPLTSLVQSKRDDKKMAQLLIDNGADVNLKDRMTGYTVLQFAASKGALEILKVMLAQDNPMLEAHGKSALELASTGLHLSSAKAIVEHARARELEIERLVNWQDEKDNSILLSTISSNTRLSARSIRTLEDSVTYLLTLGANPNQADTSGFFPLFVAVARGLEESKVINILLEHGADKTQSTPTTRWNRGETAYDKAKRMNFSPEKLRLLK